jgi:hypothetical protein
VFAACFALSATSLVFAEDSGVGLRDVKAPAGFAADELDYEELERQAFYTRGTLDAVNKTSICVGDVPIKLAPRARIKCKVGTFVGIRINEDGEAVSCEPLGRSRR